MAGSHSVHHLIADNSQSERQFSTHKHTRTHTHTFFKQQDNAIELTARQVRQLGCSIRILISGQEISQKHC